MLHLCPYFISASRAGDSTEARFKHFFGTKNLLIYICMYFYDINKIQLDLIDKTVFKIDNS